MSWIDELNNAPDVGSVYKFQPVVRQPKVQPAKKKKGNFLTSLIPSVGGIGGAAGGAALGTALLPGIGTIAGGLIGGALGGGAGKVAENQVEGSKLTSGVAGEAALNGVLGAGPLRLGKLGIDTVRGVKAGASLTDALTRAGTNAAKSSVRGAVGKKLTDASNNLAVKEFRLTPSQLTNFKNKFGEDASQVIKKYNLVGKDSEAIRQGVIQPLQGEFDTIAQRLPSVPMKTVQDAFKAKYDKLLNSAVEDNRAVGRQLKQQAETIAKKYGAEVPGSELSGLRQEFDGLVSYADKTANPARYGVNKRAADAVRSVLQQTADKVGLKSTDGKTFKEVGRELNKLHQLTDNISKQENVGRGSLPLGLTGLLGGGVGSAAGGPLGAIGGFAATKTINSTAGRKLAAAGAEKAGSKLVEGAATRNPYSVSQVASRILPVGAVGAAGNYLSSPNSNDTSSISPTTQNPATNPDIGSLSQTNSDLSSATDPNSPFAPQNIESSVRHIISNGGTLKDAQDFISLADALTKMQAPASSTKLNATQLQQANNANSGLTDLQTLADTIQSDPSVLIKDAIPGGQLARRLTGTNSYDAAKQNIVDVIARLRSGAAITQDEANRYMSLLPTYGDTPESASSKLQRLGSLLSSFANPEAAQPDLTSALLSTQGGY